MWKDIYKRGKIMNCIDELILLTKLEETLALIKEARKHRAGLGHIEVRLKGAIEFVMNK